MNPVDALVLDLEAEVRTIDEDAAEVVREMAAAAEDEVQRSIPRLQGHITSVTTTNTSTGATLVVKATKFGERIISNRVKRWREGDLRLSAGSVLEDTFEAATQIELSR